MKLFDTHCHLQAGELVAGLNDVMSRACAAGVEGMVCCGTCEADWPAVTSICGRWRGVRPAYGLHPLYVAGRTESWRASLETLLDGSGSVVGEIGLDRVAEPRSDSDQEEVFIAQMRMAAARHLPVSIHCRRAWGRMLEIIEMPDTRAPVLVFHSFSGNAEMVSRLAKLGGYFSFSGTLTRSRNRKGADAARAVPADRLLVETDSPDLAPIVRDGPATGRINEPANLRYVIGALAEIRGTTFETMAELTSRNAERCFGTR